MASTLSRVLSAGTVATEVYNYTSDGGAAAAGAGYAAWVDSVTGALPQVERLEGGRARMVLSQQQVVSMRGWLDKQIISSVTPRDKEEKLEIEFGPVIGPLLMRYLVILGAGFFLAGWLGRGMVK